MRMIREQQALRQEQEELRRLLQELTIVKQRAREAGLTGVSGKAA